MSNQISGHWQVGEVILDLYKVVSLLGQGGFGEVYRVRHLGWNIDLAVKSPKPEIVATAGGVENFEREAEAWVNLGLQPHIVSCYYVRRIDSHPLVFAEYVAGGSLHDWIGDRRLYANGVVPSLQRILDIAIQVAWGLHYAHEQGLIHQDVKPENVLITPTGTAKITDFGLASAQAVVARLDTSSAASDRKPLAAGAATPAYRAPEQTTQANVTRRTDLWGWGLTVLEMFAGERTWISGVAAAQALEQYLSTEPVHPQLPRMPLAIAQLLRRCFREQPNERPDSLEDVANELQQIYQQLTEAPYPRQAPAAADTADSLNNRAVSLWDLGRQDEALQLWEQALTAQPQHQESTYNRGLVLWRSGGTNDDSTLLRQLAASRTQVKDWQVDYLLSLVHLERGDYQEACKILEQIQPVRSEQDREPEEVTAARSVAQELLFHSMQFLPQFISDRFALQSGQTRHTVLSVALSPNSYYAVSGSDDQTVRLWELATGKCVCALQGHRDIVSSVAFSANGSYILSASGDRTIRLWDVLTTGYIRTFKGHRGAVQSAVFSPDGRYIASGSEDRTVRLWEAATGKCLRVFKGHRGSVVSVAFSADGHRLLSGDKDGMKLWEVAKGRLVQTFEGHLGHITSVACSPDGRYAASADTSIVELWDIATGQVVRTFEGHQLWLKTVVFSPDGRTLLSGGGDKLLKLWDVGTGRCLRTFEGHQFLVNALALSLEGNCALSVDADTLRVWTLGPTATYFAPLRLSQIQSTETLISGSSIYQQELAQAQIAQEHGDTVAAAQHIRNARSQPGYSRGMEAINAWLGLYPCLPHQALNGSWERATFDGHADAIRAVAFSPNGLYGLSGSSDTTLKLWEVTTGNCLRNLEGHEEAVNGATFSPDGLYVLSGSTDQTLKLWDVASGSCLRTLEGHQDGVNAIAFSPDGLYALSGSTDQTLKLWDVASGSCLRTLEGHQDGVNAVAFSPDGLYALSGSTDQTLKLWDVASGSCLRTLEGHQDGVNAVAFSPDGLYVLSGSTDQTLKLWDVASGSCLRTLEGHQDGVNAVAFSPDGLYVLSGSTDQTLKLWDVASGSCLRTLEGHKNAIQAAAFNLESQYILSGSTDTTGKLWVLDWDLADQFPQDWDEGVKPYLETFLHLHKPAAAALPQNRTPNEKELTLALSRRGTPTWTDLDFNKLLNTLGTAGYGWLQPEVIYQQLIAMVPAIAKASPARVPEPLVSEPLLPEPLVSEPLLPEPLIPEPLSPKSPAPKLSLPKELLPNLSSEPSPELFPEPANATAFATAFATVFGDAPAETAAKVILTVTEGSLKGEEFEFSDRTTCIIGRTKDCNLQLPNDKQHETISRYHCLLDINPPAVWIRDLGSLHGTYVNGQLIGQRQPNQTPAEVAQVTFPEHNLVSGDEIRLGKITLQVRIEEVSVESDPPTMMAAVIATSIDQQTEVASQQSAAIAPVAIAPVDSSPRPASPSNAPVNGQDPHLPLVEGYTTLRKLGEGASGQVYLARNHQSDDLVALKIMQPKVAVRMPLIDTFLREVDNTRALQHLNIVRLLDSGYSNGTFFFSLEYCEGGSIADLIQQQEGQLSVDQAIPMILQVLDGLEYAHNAEIPHAKLADGSWGKGWGLVHRDLKPANILLTQIQGAQVAKIADYGLAKAFDQAGLSGLSVSGTTAGTPAFMPRQLAVNFKYAKPEVDVWAIAACLYTMLTGVPPRDFSGKDPYLALLQTNAVPILQRNPAIPKSLAELIDIALVDDPEICFKNAAAFKRALKSVL